MLAAVCMVDAAMVIMAVAAGVIPVSILVKDALSMVAVVFIPVAVVLNKVMAMFIIVMDMVAMVRLALIIVIVATIRVNAAARAAAGAAAATAAAANGTSAAVGAAKETASFAMLVTIPLDELFRDFMLAAAVSPMVMTVISSVPEAASVSVSDQSDRRDCNAVFIVAASVR